MNKSIHIWLSNIKFIFRLYNITFFLFEIIGILCYKCIGVENVHASYSMYEGVQLTFRDGNDNLDLG